MTDGDPGGPPEFGPPPRTAAAPIRHPSPNTRSTSRGGGCATASARPGDRWERLVGERKRRPQAPPAARAAPSGSSARSSGSCWPRVAWVLLSVVLFFVSAQIEQGSAHERRTRALPRRQPAHRQHRAGARLRPAAGGRARAGRLRSRPLGQHHAAARRLRQRAQAVDPARLLCRDPGPRVQKINAAYALGGAGLTIKTVEGFLGNGVKINHVVEVSFNDFPKLIDALGRHRRDAASSACVAQRVRERRRVPAPPRHASPERQAGARVLARPQEQVRPERGRHPAGRAPAARAPAIRAKALSPTTFFRLPWVAWDAPRAVRTDLRRHRHGCLIGDLVTGGSGSTHVLKPSGVGPGTSLIISPAEASGRGEGATRAVAA